MATKFSISNGKRLSFFTNGSILFAISTFAILIEEITSCADSGTKKKCCKKLTRKLERKSPRSYKRQMFEVKATLIGLHLRPFVTGCNNGFKFFQNLKKVVRYWCIFSKGWSINNVDVTLWYCVYMSLWTLAEWPIDTKA